MLKETIPYDTIRSMPYKLLLYELEKARQLAEKNKKQNASRELEKKLTGKGSNNPNLRGPRSTMDIWTKGGDYTS